MKTEQPKQISLKNMKITPLDLSGQYSSKITKLISYYFQNNVEETEGMSFPDQTHGPSVVKYYCRCVRET